MKAWLGYPTSLLSLCCWVLVAKTCLMLPPRLLSLHLRWSLLRPQLLPPWLVGVWWPRIMEYIIIWKPLRESIGLHPTIQSHHFHRWRIFIYTYLGFFIASVGGSPFFLLWVRSHQLFQITGHFLGAIFAASATNDPTWEAGFDHGNSVGGLINAVLAPAGGFGNFLTVLLALTIPSACTSSFSSWLSFFERECLGRCADYVHVRYEFYDHRTFLRESSAICIRDCVGSYVSLTLP